MQFQQKLLASGVPTSWCPSVIGFRCPGLSVFQVVSRCTGVSLFYNLFSNCFSVLTYRLLWVRAVLVRLCEYCFATAFAMCLCCEHTVLICCQNIFLVLADASYLFSTNAVQAKYCNTEWIQLKLGHKSNKIRSTLTLLRTYHCTAFPGLSYCCQVLLFTPC